MRAKDRLNLIKIEKENNKQYNKAYSNNSMLPKQVAVWFEAKFDSAKLLAYLKQ